MIDLRVLAFWLLGALIGVAAAQKKGFSMVAGVLGGLLLGPFAFLMFFVSGISAEDRNRKCPYCAEFVKADASVCKHCHRDLPTAFKVSAQRERRSLLTLFLIAIVIVLVLTLAVLLIVRA